MSLLSAGDIAGMVDTLGELANCHLIEIAEPGTLDDYGDAGTPIVTWTGSVAAHLLTEDKDVLSSNVQVEVQKTTLRVFDGAGTSPALLHAGADWEAASVVVRDERGTVPVERRWTVVGFEHESDQSLNSVLLTINDERDP